MSFDTPERLHPGRLRLLGLLLLCVAFVSIGVLMLVEGEWTGLLVGGFFALGVLLFPPMLFSRWNHLQLDAEGMRCRTLWRERRWRWEEIAAIGVADFGGGPCVAIRLRREPAEAVLVAASRALTGWDDALPDRYGLSADALLARIEARWLAATQAAESDAASGLSPAGGQR